MSAQESDSKDQIASAKHGLPARPPAAQNAAVFAFKPRAMAPAARTSATHENLNPAYYSSNATTLPHAAARNYQGFATTQSQDSYPAAYSDTQTWSAAGYASNPDWNYNPNQYAQQDYGASQWQSQATISAPPTTKNGAPQKSAAAPKPARADNRTVIRSGGGKTWEDPSLLDWPADHHRLFIGNLAGEVTDESLLKAFSKYPSVSKARVIRNSSTSKSEGFGFVSLADADEYFQAAKEMNGKYIGSHPVTISQAKGNKKGNYKVVEKDEKYYRKYHGKKGRQNHVSGSGSGAAAGMPVKSSAQSTQEVLKADSSGGIRKVGKGGQKMKVLG